MVGLWPIGALCAMAAMAAAPEPATRAGSAREVRTKILPGHGYIRYEVLPGDDAQPAGELIVTPPEQAGAAQSQLALAPEPEPRLQRRSDPCGAERGKLLQRVFLLRGLDVDAELARWIERNLTLGSNSLTGVSLESEALIVTAIKADGVARGLAEDLARCEAARR